MADLMCFTSSMCPNPVFSLALIALGRRDLNDGSGSMVMPLRSHSPDYADCRRI